MTHTAKHKGPQKWDNYFSTKKTCGKNVSPPSKLYVESPSWKNVNLNLYSELLLPKENFFGKVSSQTTTVYIVAKRTPLTILLATVLLLKNAHMRSLVGSMLRTKLTSIRPWKRNCSVFYLNNLKKSVTKKFNYTLLFMKYYIYTYRLHTNSILLPDFVNKISLKYRIECIEA